MRCLACDSALTDAMSRARMPKTGEYWQLCGRCLDTVKKVNAHLYTKDVEVHEEPNTGDNPNV